MSQLPSTSTRVMPTLASFTDAFWASFINDERVGGPDGIADFTAETFDKAKDNENIETRSRFLTIVLKQMESYDERNETPDEYEFDHEEMESRLMSTVITNLRNNEELALIVGKEAIAALARHPEALAELQQSMAAHEGLLNG